MDEMERMARFYDRKTTEAVVDAEVSFTGVLEKARAGESLSYMDWLNLDRAMSAIQRNMSARDVFGTHSETGRALFAHIAHPNKTPKPEPRDAAVTVGAA